MEAIQKMEAGKYYLIESTASANSVYFENDDLSKLFFRYCDYYLKDYIHVKEYALNADGWVMLIKVKTSKTIRKHYDMGFMKRNPQIENDLKVAPEIWRILSERVRLFISTYVRMSNKILGREGTLVRRKYGRYQFDCMEEAQDYISTIRKNKHKLQQPKDKYQGLENHFQMSGTNFTNPLRSSLWVEICAIKQCIQERMLKIFEVELPILKGIGDLVAQNIKLDNHATEQPPSKPPKP